ncbi:MAG: O-antigen ligase family protein [Chloroflexota bacterium]|nr:O-antigen ligase family protein [Chloroflexota bacterium]
MAQNLSTLVTPYHKNQASESRDQIGFGLSILALCLLPIERVALPLGLKPVDFVLVLLVLYGLAQAWRTRQRLEFPLLLPLWLILFSSSVAALVGIAKVEGIIAVVQEIYLFVWFIVLTNVLRMFSLSDLDRLLKVWSIIACIEAATTVMGMFRIGPSMFYTLPYRDRNITTVLVRSVGTYINPNAVAVYLSVSFFIVLATSWPTWLRSALAVWLFAGMFGTGSNGALITTLGGLAVLMVVHSITKMHRGILLWGAITFIGMGLVATSLLVLAIEPSLLSGLGVSGSGHALYLTVGRFSRSLGDRFELIGWAWQIFSHHPWGVGPNAFSTIRASLHNDYAAFLFERGPVGIIGWLWMIGATLLMPLRAANQSTDGYQHWQILAPGAGFLACAVNALSHEISHMRQVWMLMVFLFALSYAHLAQQAANAPSDTASVREGI